MKRGKNTTYCGPNYEHMQNINLEPRGHGKRLYKKNYQSWNKLIRNTKLALEDHEEN